MILSQKKLEEVGESDVCANKLTMAQTHSPQKF